MLSRLQELRKEEETLLRVKAALYDQLNRLKVEELALQSMIDSREGNGMVSSPPLTEDPPNIMVHVDNEVSINQTELQLSLKDQAEEQEEEEEEEESDS
ncbi:snRNA-activating protein complex subunit 5 [Tachyglossus aculeatus]|uniref:snRNA-activating protein complex subunit 5 n=1 Tax=Tachyglossus aculeatus TaxID=9261 RepID=UPI0018F3F842|nr:snRNA-activating protein complex subunit 5 [Tachyglossus aculeatus]